MKVPFVVVVVVARFRAAANAYRCANTASICIKSHDLAVNRAGFLQWPDSTQCGTCFDASAAECPSAANMLTE